MLTFMTVHRKARLYAALSWEMHHQSRRVFEFWR